MSVCVTGVQGSPAAEAGEGGGGGSGNWNKADMAVCLCWIQWPLSLIPVRGQGLSCLLGGMARY